MRPRPYLPALPKPPVQTKVEKIIRYNEICSIADKAYYWPKNDENQEEVPDLGQKVRQRLFLSKIIKLLPSDISIDEVYLTASFQDEYLYLHAGYDAEIDPQQEENKKYNKEMDHWMDLKFRYDQDIKTYQKELEEELASLKEPLL